MAVKDSFIKKNKQLKKPMDIMNVGFVGAASGGASITASGASYSQSGGYDYYKWTSNGSVEISGMDVQVLVVGAGGGLSLIHI